MLSSRRGQRRRKEEQRKGMCENCPQPLGNHCEGCCVDFQYGIKDGKFCGKKGNYIDGKPR